MAKLPQRLLIVAALMAAETFSYGIQTLQAAECKRKTAGFFLQDAPTETSHKLATSLKSIPASLTGGLGDPERGRDVLVSRQKGDCLSCHQVSALSSVSDQGGIGPALDGIGGRYSDAQLRQIMVEPKVYFPDTIMPAYYRPPGSADATVLSPSEVEDLIAYLKTLK